MGFLDGGLGCWGFGVEDCSPLLVNGVTSATADVSLTAADVGNGWALGMAEVTAAVWIKRQNQTGETLGGTDP